MKILLAPFIVMAMFFELFASNQIYVKRDNAYVREGPGSYYPLLTVLERGSQIEQLSVEGGWYKVQLQDNRVGWIAVNCMEASAPRGAEVAKISKTWSSARASRSGLAAAIKGFAQKYGKASPGDADAVFAYSRKNFDAKDVADFCRPLVAARSENKGRLEIADLDLDNPNYDPSFEEQGIGVGIAARLISKGIITDEHLKKYVNLIAASIAQSSGIYDWDFTVFVLNDPRINGFACPGGYIFITLGAIKACDDESMLAAVIAHEMGHVIRRHGLQEMTNRLVDIKADQAFDELEEETEAKTETDEELESLAENGYELVVHKRLLSYEMEADKISSILCANAGYDPRGIVSMDQKIAQLGQKTPDVLGDDFTIENDPQERFVEINKFVSKKFSEDQPGIRMRDRFQSQTAEINK